MTAENDIKCQTCKHWRRVETDIGNDQFEIVLIPVGHPLRWEEVGRCHAQKERVELIAAGSVTFDHPVTHAAHKCSLYEQRGAEN
ncbi:MAG: hypothetical protein OXF33_02125 [Rhodospirillales bacterium]|nr:hypothetical protein [Rhodospirillales bacterium]